MKRTHDDGRDRVEHDVLEPRVHVVQDEEREERRGVHCAGLNDEDQRWAQRTMSEGHVISCAVEGPDAVCDQC